MGGFGFLLIIVAFAFLYFVLVRPQKRRQLAQQQMLAAVDVGDEIVTAGGLYGEVREVHEDEVLVRIAPELDVRVARRAIAGIVGPEADTDGTELEPEAEPDPEPDPEQAGPTTDS